MTSNENATDYISFEFGQSDEGVKSSPDREQPPQSQNEGTLIVFDWDNTLFPTKALKRMESRSRKSKYILSDLDELSDLSHWVHRVLSEYISFYGSQSICFVTAEKRGWVESTLRSLSGIGVWAQIRSLLDGLYVVCAHSSILPFAYKEHILSHKLEAFQYHCRRCPFRVRMLVSIGDSAAEFEASKLCADGNEGMSVGRVKLQKRPSLRCLIRQCQFVLDLCANLQPENFDIDMSY